MDDFILSDTRLGRLKRLPNRIVRDLVGIFKVSKGSKSKQKTILVVSRICPAPLVHGNRIQIMQMLRWLRSKGYRIIFVLQKIEPDAEPSLLKSLVDQLVVIGSPQGWFINATSKIYRETVPKHIRAIIKGKTSLFLLQSGKEVCSKDKIDSSCWPTTLKTVKKLVKQCHPFAVFSEYIFTSKCLEGLPDGTLKVLDTLEVFHRNIKQYDSNWFPRESVFICTPEDERRCFERADVLLAIQDHDKRAIEALVPHKKVIKVVNPGARFEAMEPDPFPGRVLYVGSGNTFNAHGLRAFLENAWPLVVGQVPYAVLHVVGPFSEMGEKGWPNVVFVGIITDLALASEYRRAEVIINPQLVGTGLKIKNVEAMAMGRAMVMTAAGADGIEDGVEEAYLLARNWPEFAGHVSHLLKDASFRKRIETEALNYAKKHFSLEAAFSELDIILRAAYTVPTEHLLSGQPRKVL